MKKRIDVNELIWFLILLSLTVYLYSVLKDGSVLRFIHPRMKGFIYFLCIALAALAVFQVPKLFEEHKKEKIKKGYIMFIIPLILIMAVDPQGLSSDISKKKGLIFVDSSNSTSASDEEELIENGSKSNKAIEITNANFYKVYEELYKNPNNYYGRKIVVSGFAYKTEDSKEGDFIVGRMLITCCAADASMLGFVCRSSETTLLKVNKWVNITGKLSQTIYNDKNTEKNINIPLIEVEKVEYIEKPDNQYIYK